MEYLYLFCLLSNEKCFWITHCWQSIYFFFFYWKNVFIGILSSVNISEYLFERLQKRRKEMKKNIMYKFFIFFNSCLCVDRIIWSSIVHSVWIRFLSFFHMFHSFSVYLFILFSLKKRLFHIFFIFSNKETEKFSSSLL